MLAYIGISLLAIFALIAAIRWGTEKAGYTFPKRFWTVCFVSVILVTMLVPRMVLGTFGLGWTLLFSVFLLFLTALWISFAFLPTQKLAAEEGFIVDESSTADESILPAVDEVFLLPNSTAFSLDESIHNENTPPVCTTWSLPIEPLSPEEAANLEVDAYAQSLTEAMTAFTALEEQLADCLESTEATHQQSELLAPDNLFTSEADVFAPQLYSPLETTVVNSRYEACNDNIAFSDHSFEPNDREELAPLPVEAPLSVDIDEVTVSTLPEEETCATEPGSENPAVDFVFTDVPPAATSVEALLVPDEPVTAEDQDTIAEQGQQENILLSTQEPEGEKNVVGTLERSLPKSDSLEDLLDYALMQRSRKQFSEALSAIKAAVLLYGEKDPESLPYLIIELANIYKEQGNYEQAIQAFQEGQSQLAGEAFIGWREQFVVSIAYLRIVRNTLIAHQQPMMPLDTIPTTLKEEIEEEFAEWNRLS